MAVIVIIFSLVNVSGGSNSATLMASDLHNNTSSAAHKRSHASGAIFSVNEQSLSEQKMQVGPPF